MQPVITRDVQVHPVNGKPLHVDLMRVDDKTRIKVEIPVRFINEEECPGLKKGGVLNVVRHTIEVYAPATALPEVFEIDVEGLDVGDGVHASALKLSEGVTLVTTDRDFTIVTVAAPSALRSAEEEEADAAAAAEAAEGEEGEAAEGEAAEGEAAGRRRQERVAFTLSFAPCPIEKMNMSFFLWQGRLAAARSAVPASLAW